MNPNPYAAAEPHTGPSLPTPQLSPSWTRRGGRFMESDWQEIHRLGVVPPHQPGIAPVIAFDSNSELLWIGNDQGYITSYSGVELRKYTSYRGHNSTDPVGRSVRQIQFNERGVVSVAARSLHFGTRGGLAQWNLLDDRFQKLNCMAYTSRGTSEVLVAGGQKTMFTVNLERGTVGSEIPTDEDIKVIKRSPRHIVTGTVNGNARLLDMNSFKVVKEFTGVHNGTILDMDTHENLLITCGYSMRHGGYMVDPLVKIYDLRMQKALPPLSFPGAAFIRMHPKMTAAAIIASNTGQFQVADVMNPSALRLYHANIQSYITALDLSPTGDILAMLDADGYLQLWSSSGKTKFTDLSAPIDWPETTPPRSTTKMKDDTPLNTIGMPFYTEELLSAWPAHVIYEVPKMPQKIDADTLSATSVSGYAPYHRRLPRNYVEKTRGVDNLGIVPLPKFLSQQSRDRASRNLDDEEDKLFDGDDSRQAFEVPPIYKKLEIKYSRFGVDDFDFEFYNRTLFSGLETNIPNSYMNPLLQLYRFTPRLRNVALFHTASDCAQENCLLCQMGFLFDMLEKAGGHKCQATNFLLTLGQIPNAARLGVLEDDSSSSGSLTLMMQNLNRFLLDQNIYDQREHNKRVATLWPSEDMDLSSVLMIKATKSQRCTVCHKETRPIGDTVTSDLIYSAKPLNNKPLQSFAATIKQSIQLETTQKGWCDKCRRYQSQATRKSIAKLPDILTFNVTTSDKNMNLARDHWSTPGWLPDRLGIDLNNKHLNVYQGEEIRHHEKKGVNLKIYELVGFVAEIHEEGPARKHMVSFVNVALSSNNPDGESNWHLFNDFLVRKIKKEQALDFTPKWKMPSVLCFQLKSEQNVIDNSWRDTINTSILYADFPREPTVVPLKKEAGEVPTEGTVIALDAEFVNMQREVTEVKADGTRAVVRPNRMALARVSVLRGQGELSGVPFIDDYIKTKDTVVDYVTEYSGIHPGDLDVNVSTHALVSLKVAYKRLWILLNLGCMFVGHGLSKDFRTINIHIPKSQVIDTVDLFALRSSQRKLSLRFLAWVIFNENIQLQTHDSIEDSRTALRLYRKYQEYEDAGVIEEVYDRIYTEGVRSNYKPPVPPDSLGMANRLKHLENDSLPRSENVTPQPRAVIEH